MHTANRRTGVLKTSLLCLFVCSLVSLNCVAAAPDPAVDSAPQVAAPSLPNSPKLIEREEEVIFTEKRYFKDLTPNSPIMLQGGLGMTHIDFGTRGDEIIKSASVHFSYTPSPALITNLSHIKVYLNDELIGVLPTKATSMNELPNKELPIDKEKKIGQLTQTLAIDARLFKSFNQLRLNFIGHYAEMCEDLTHTSLWADISTDSFLELEIQPLALVNNLNIFPEPFFDKRDFRKLKLPFVFAAQASKETLHTAGILASWFGAQADWRGAQFPVYQDELPDHHAIVFATNDERPAFLRDYPKVDAPTVEIISHPYNRFVKLLLVHGRDHKDLETVVKGVVLGQAILGGHASTVRDLQPIAEREPYDAPAWVRTDRAMTIGELVESPLDLQVQGYQADPIRVNLRVPADLFTWESDGIPVDLKYRYTPPVLLDESRLSVSINDEFIEAFHLNQTGEPGDSSRVRVPLVEDWLFGPSSQLHIPAFKLGSRNQLQFRFSFARLKRQGCADDPLFNTNASIDANSVIDFTGFPHYAAMPNLSHFANIGFPFTRMADLSDTVVVFNDNPSKAEIYTLLNVLGHLGASTGYPALGYQLVSPADTQSIQKKDLLVIGSLNQAKWNESGQDKLEDKLPLLIEQTKRAIAPPIGLQTEAYQWFGFKNEHDLRSSHNIEVESTGSIGAIIGFESPVSASQSVVALLANSPTQLAIISESLADFDKVNQIRGSTVIYRDNTIASFSVGKNYYIGGLPTLTLVWYHLSRYPIVLAFVAIFAVVIIAFAFWRILKAIAKNRLQG